MTATLYTRYEVARTFRNYRFLIFSVVFPVVLYLLIAGPNKDVKIQHLPFTLYLMTGMVAWGTMAAVLASGVRIADDRALGWGRQLRITPLSTRTYIGTKVLSGYVMAFVSIAVLYSVGTLLGVRLSAGEWLTMTGLILVGLIPFAAMGLVLGHLISVDSMGPALGGITSLFAVLGGSWGPIATSGALRDLVELLPSYWLVQAGKVGLGERAWPLKAWIVIAVWTVVMARLAIWAYRRDTGRT